MPRGIPKEVRDAATEIGRFVERHQLEYSQFEKLRTHDTVFETLSERRMRDWAPIPGMPLPKRSPQRSTRVYLVRLATWIQSDEQALLRAIGAGPKAGMRAMRSVNSTNSTRSAHVCTIEDIPRHALQLAIQGYVETAIVLLVTEIRRNDRVAPEQAFRVLPMLIYLLYRYCTPRELSRILSDVLQNLAESSSGAAASDISRNTSLAHLACALNERGKGKESAEIFFCPEVRAVLDTQENDWPLTQLLRNFANYWAVHAHRPAEALAITHQAVIFSPHDQANLRAAATIRCLAFLNATTPNPQKAFDAMQPYYQRDRLTVLDAAARSSSEIPDLLHLFSGLYFGTVSRALCDKPYRKHRDMLDDIHAIRWCQEQFGELQLDDGAFTVTSSQLPAELAQVRIECGRPPLSEIQAAPIYQMKELLSRPTKRRGRG